MTNNTNITKDLPGRKIHVTRSFHAPVDKVWKAWTESSLLDQWWAPKPWKAETKSMDFKEGGSWIYLMKGPDGTGSWSRVDFKTIAPQNSFSTTATFCDENGTPNKDFPNMHWMIGFKPEESGTTVEVEISFDKDADLNMILEMGFEGGFTMGLNNLEELLAGSFN